MSELDPPRLASLEDAPELTDLLRSAQGFAPSDDVVSRLAANLGLPPPGGGGGGGTGSPPPAPLGSGAPSAAAAVPAKALGLVALVSGAVVAAYVAFGAGPQKTPAASAPVVVAAPAPRPVIEASPVAPLVAPAPAPSSKASAPQKPAVEKPSEVELVGRAQKALRADPARALALTSEHRQLYPRGTLAQEREVLAIEALAALGRGEAARARAAAFESASPGSPYAVRVARAIKKSEPAEH